MRYTLCISVILVSIKPRSYKDHKQTKNKYKYIHLDVHGRNIPVKAQDAGRAKGREIAKTNSHIKFQVPQINLGNLLLLESWEIYEGP